MFGRLLFVRVRNQNSLVVNLPVDGHRRRPDDADHRVRRAARRRSRSTARGPVAAGTAAPRGDDGHPARGELPLLQPQLLVPAAAHAGLLHRHTPPHGARACSAARPAATWSLRRVSPRPARARPPCASSRLPPRSRSATSRFSSRGFATCGRRRSASAACSKPRSPRGSRASITTMWRWRPRRTRGWTAAARNWRRPAPTSSGSTRRIVGDCPYPALTLALVERSAARRPQPALPRRPRAAIGRLQALVPRRPRVVPGLPRVLHRARDRAPVVGPGGRLEELPRAVAERGVRAVLRGALRRAGARPARCSTTSCAACGGGRWTSRTRGRCISATASATSRATAALFRAIVYNKGAMVLHMLRAPRRRRGVLRGHPALLRALAIREGRIGRPATGDGGGSRGAARTLLRPVGVRAGTAAGRLHVARGWRRRRPGGAPALRAGGGRVRRAGDRHARLPRQAAGPA